MECRNHFFYSLQKTTVVNGIEQLVRKVVQEAKVKDVTKVMSNSESQNVHDLI